MKKFEYDAVVIGTGCAGYNCADWLCDFGVTNIAVVTEGKKTGTSRNTGSDKQTYYKLTLCGDAEDSVYKMAQTLFSGGAMDGDIALCEAANSVRSFLKLANLGVRFPTNEFGEYVGYKTDHDPFTRATSVGPYTSKKMTEALEQSVERKNITILDKCQVIRLLTENGKITGLLGIDLSDENRGYIAIKTPYVVMATGGPASVYFDSVYPAGHTGNSSLAFKVGAEFVNLSEWQYGLASTDFRWNVSGTYQQVLPRYISVDGEGIEREFLLDYMSPEEMLKNIFLKGYEWPFDVRKIYGSSYIDLLVYHETVVKGRSVYLDFTKEPTGLDGEFKNLDERAYEYLKSSDALLPTPVERLKKMNGGAVLLYREHGIDLEKQPLKIAVCAQHNNGGVRVDTDWQTNIEGLYCCGEAAGTLGIFRPGGTALNSSQVGSLRSARHIAYFGKNKASERFDEILSDAVRESDSLIAKTNGKKSTYREQRIVYQKEMSKNFAFLRNIADMKKHLQTIRINKEKFFVENQWIKRSEIPEIFKNYDIIEMQTLIAECMLESAKRYGSRGSAFVLGSGTFLERKPMPENECGRKEIIVMKKVGGQIQTEIKAVKPIPERNLWFEKVWNEYNKTIRENI